MEVHFRLAYTILEYARLIYKQATSLVVPTAGAESLHVLA